MRTRIARCLTTTVLTAVGLCWITPAFAQLSPNMQDILRRIHTTQEFGAGGRGAGAGGRWVDGGAGLCRRGADAGRRHRDRALRHRHRPARRPHDGGAADAACPRQAAPVQRLHRVGRRPPDALRHQRPADDDPEDRVRLLDARQGERRLAQARRHRRGRPAVREAVARRLARGLRPRQQPVCRRPAHRRDDGAHERRVADDYQRHLRLGLRRGIGPARRIPVEPGRQAHRLLPVRPDRRAGVHAHQLHRRAVSRRSPGTRTRRRARPMPRCASAWWRRRAGPPGG